MTITLLGFSQDTIPSEQKAYFLGGEEKLFEYLKKEPEQAKSIGIEGKVYINFTIKKDGTIDNIKIIRGLGYGADEEAFRLVKNMPNWIPAKLNNEPIDMIFNLPIKFNIEDN